MLWQVWSHSEGQSQRRRRWWRAICSEECRPLAVGERDDTLEKGRLPGEREGG